MTLSRADRGFTLIEILVVLTIIGLLVALLFPVFASARLRSHLTVCESNLHQIGLAIQMYQGDNDGVLPTYFFDASALPAPEQAGHDLLSPYIHDPNVYHCPDAHGPPPAPHSGLLRLDYHYRVYDLLSFDDVHGLPDALMKPEPSTVLVYDDNHHQGDSITYAVLRASGSAALITGNHVVNWFNWGRAWNTTCCGLSSPSWPPSPPWPVFPGESWPPQFEKVGH